MIRKVIILFSLCCAVLCAFVGYLSYNVTQESEKVVGPAETISCQEILDSKPSQASRVMFTEFAPGKHLAFLDTNQDAQWDSLCVPFFPPKNRKIGHGYRAVLVCFKNVPTRDALDALIESEELDVSFWPERQALERAIYSQLAQNYTNLDLANSPILYYGYETQNPVLGSSTLYAAAAVGSVSLLVALLTMIVGLFAGLFKSKKKTPFDINTTERPPTTNRAGLPDGQAPSIFDQMTSARSSSSK